MTKLLSPLTAVVVGLTVVGLSFTAYSLKHQTLAPVRADIEAAKRPAVASTPNRAPVPAGLVAGNGLVEPNGEETRVGSEVPGLITVVSVTEGQHVKQGDVLIEFDHAVEEALLSAAEAEVEVAEATLARVKHGLRGQEISAIIAESGSAEARKLNAQSELERAEALSATGSISSAELDRARRAAEAERAASEAAQARAKLARSGSRYEDIAIAMAHAKAARARRDQAAAALKLKIVRSPITGEVLRVKAKVGELYTPQSAQPLVLVGDTSKLRVRLDIDERDVAQVAVGAKAYITAPAFGETHFGGKVASVSRRLGRRTIRTDEPTDRIDVKILEVVIDVDDTTRFIPGLRVTGFIERAKQ